MNDAFDVNASVLSTKSEENALAFAGFHTAATPETPAIEGVLKIASAAGNTASGYLTLTFILDLEDNFERQHALKQRFKGVGEDALGKLLGPDFDYLLAIPLDVFAESRQFFLEELNIYFRNLAGREKSVIEQYIVPALARQLQLQFDPLNWLGEKQTAPPPTTRAAAVWTRVKNLARQARSDT